MIITIQMYHKIHRLKNSNLTIRDIASRLGFSKNTVKKYLSMTPDEYKAYSEHYHNRAKCFDVFESEIIEIFQKAKDPNLSSASVYDVLEEMHGDMPASERSFRNYMRYLRMSSKLDIEEHREYERMPELPYGQQMQLDFGEYRMKDTGKKYYILAALLSRSRYRYVQAYEKPLTTAILIEGLLDCFEYFEGMPEEIVIDQDHLMVANENAGDIRFTKEFDDFRKEMGFNMYVCRKADPESKGKVENLVKFCKRSFFASRPMSCLKEVRTRLAQWLCRKANGKKSAAIGMKPAEAFKEEKAYLKPLKNSIFTPADKCDYETRKADKTATISVKGQKMEVPHNYANKDVLVYITDSRADIRDIKTKELLAQYSFTKGILKTTVVKLSHKRMEKNNEIRTTLLGKFQCKEWNQFIDGWNEHYRRFSKDQFKIFAKYEADFKDQERFIRSLRYCIETESYSMANLHEVYMAFTREDMHETQIQSNNLDLSAIKHYQGIVVAKRSLDEYMNRTGSNTRNGSDHNG